MGLKMGFIMIGIASIFLMESCNIAKGIMIPGSDITQDILQSWSTACNSISPSKVVVPKGNFKLKEATLQGPCKAPIEFNLQGVLQAPPIGASFTDVDTWFRFQNVEFLTVSGDGIFDGQGKSSRGEQCKDTEYCKNIPINMIFSFVMHSVVQGVTSLDSKQFHIKVLDSKNITFQHIKIIADGNSQNTDGIHIVSSTDIKILDSNIQTGDDCVSVGPGSHGITISNVACGPGHGFSIGSLGRYANEEPVTGVFVKGCTLTNTQNGVRVKTWPGAEAGKASDLHFEDIVMNNVRNPVIIDQEYCPYNRCSINVPSRVQISGVSFNNIRGTSSTPLAVKLVCSQGLPCQQISLTDINLKYSGKGLITSVCENVAPIVAGIQNPPACVTHSTLIA